MRVAIAGYSDLTRYICAEFPKAGHELVILTRSHKPQLEEQENITQIITDYTLPSLEPALADCDGLISTISDYSPAYTSVHKTLLQACQSSPKCKRFIPAEFATNIETYPDQPGFYYGPHEPVREALRNQTDVEWTLLCIGWLTDYFVPSSNRYIKDIGVCHCTNWGGSKIIIPGTGNEPVDFTWARDVIRGLMALLNAARGSWEPYIFMSGERSSWNATAQFFCQKYRPGTPIEHVSLYQAVEMVKTAKDEETLMLADYHLLSISNACGNPPDKVRMHREKYFSNVHFRTVQEGLSQFDKDPKTIL